MKDIDVIICDLDGTLVDSKEAIANGDIDLTDDTIHAALLTSAYTIDIDADANWSDIVANEVVGTGYVAGGKALASKTVTQDDANDQAVFDATDAQWNPSTITARYVVIYKNTGTDSTSTLIGVIDFVSDQISSNNDFTVQWSANGILTLK